MATFGEILETVKDIVRRPDLDARVELKVISAVTACHQLAEFIRDREEFITDVAVAPAFIGTAPYSNDLRVTESMLVYGLDANDTIIKTLDLHSPGEIAKLQLLGQEVDTAYIINNSISFNSKVELTKLLVFAYAKQPKPSIFLNLDGTRADLTTAPITSYRTWLLDDYEEAVIDYAVGYIETLKGNRELAKTHLDMFKDVHTPQLINLASGGAGL